tara:strand:+ start:14598 stop:15515 length:918 start_codon:yes stop_codon:yes gene_type:complete
MADLLHIENLGHIENLEQFLAASFFVLLALAAFLESLIPLRKNALPLRRRWLGNFSLMLLNTAIFRGLLPMSAFVFALYVQEHHWGLFSAFPLSPWLSILITVLLHDFVKYAQHVLFHHVRACWRFHLVHHTDQDYDFTTGLRFHPLEALVTTASTFLVILVLGPPALAVIVFEFLTMFINFLSHTNIRLNDRLERILRFVIVTPNMHRIHHSAWEPETNSNYAVIFSFWDKIFGTYTAQAREDQKDMMVGLYEYRDLQDQNFFRMLLQPFLKLKPRLELKPQFGDATKKATRPSSLPDTTPDLP